MLYLEIGNTTWKLARRGDNGNFIVDRFSDPDEALPALERTNGEIVVAAVAAGDGRAYLNERLVESGDEGRTRFVERSSLLSFVRDTYDTPETLGLDRILNLFSLDRDAVVISCGTAITIDALLEGRPVWGAIMPGFRTAAESLHTYAPALPVASADDPIGIPARSSRNSVANGVFLGTALAARAIAERLRHEAGLSAGTRIVLTGGDADLLRRLWNDGGEVEIRDALLFEGMERWASHNP